MATTRYHHHTSIARDGKSLLLLKALEFSLDCSSHTREILHNTGLGPILALLLADYVWHGNSSAISWMDMGLVLFWATAFSIEFLVMALEQGVLVVEHKVSSIEQRLSKAERAIEMMNVPSVPRICTLSGKDRAGLVLFLSSVAYLTPHQRRTFHLVLKALSCIFYTESLQNSKERIEALVAKVKALAMKLDALEATFCALEATFYDLVATVEALEL